LEELKHEEDFAKKIISGNIEEIGEKKIEETPSTVNDEEQPTTVNDKEINGRCCKA